MSAQVIAIDRRVAVEREHLSLVELREIAEDADAGGHVDTAILVLAAIDRGTDERALSEFTGLTPDFIAPRAKRLRAAGLWVGEYALTEPTDTEYEWLVMICLFALVAEGEVQRAPPLAPSKVKRRAARLEARRVGGCTCPGIRKHRRGCPMSSAR